MDAKHKQNSRGLKIKCVITAEHAIRAPPVYIEVIVGAHTLGPTAANHASAFTLGDATGMNRFLCFSFCLLSSSWSAASATGVLRPRTTFCSPACELQCCSSSVCTPRLIGSYCEAGSAYCFSLCNRPAILCVTLL